VDGLILGEEHKGGNDKDIIGSTPPSNITH
jgi:hypothetical protein